MEPPEQAVLLEERPAPDCWMSAVAPTPYR
jgi:hypothetical protein